MAKTREKTAREANRTRVRERRTRRERRVERRERRVRRELSSFEKNILWCFALGSRSSADVATALDISRERAEEEISRLTDHGFLMNQGGFFRNYELSAQGYQILGTAGVKLEARLTSISLRSGEHTRLIITARNAGSAPITDAVIRIVAPRFLTISRFGSEYERNEETAVIDFPVTHLNPGESQTIEFNLHGALTSGTVSSRYKVLVHALTGGTVTDRKELEIALLA